MARSIHPASLVALVLAAGSAASVAHAQSWAAAVNGDWFTPTNWSPASVPTGVGATGTLGLAGAYTVTTASNTLASVNITDSLAVLGLNPGASLQLFGSGPGVVNTLNGQILVNTIADYNGTNLSVGGANVTFSGTGTIRMNASASDPSTTIGTSQISGAGSLVMNSGTSWAGFGRMAIGASTNNGTFTADIPGRVLRMDNGTHQNTNLYTAANGGALVVVGATVNQSGAGRLAPAAGSSIQLHSTSVNGGVITSLPTGRVEFDSGVNGLSAVTINGGVDLAAGTTTVLGAPGITLAGGATVKVNTIADYNGTHLRVTSAGTPVSGSGTIRLNASASDPGTTVATSAISATGPGSLTVNSGVNLAGFGIVSNTPTTNNGVFNADTTGRPLRVDSNSHQNNNLYTATNGGALVLVNDTITQAPGAGISAVGASGDGTVISNVQLYNTSVTGGSITSNGAARVQVNPAVGATLTNVVINGGLDCYYGSNVYLDSPGITLNGGATLLINPTGDYASTYLRTGDANTTIGGNGTVRLNSSASDPSTTVNTAAVTEDGGPEGGSFVFAPGVTLAGFGIVINVPTTNNGVFNADVNGRPLRIGGSTHQNNNLYQSSNGGTLVTAATTINQSGSARLLAGNGSGVVLSSTRINGGTVGSLAGSDGQTVIDNTEVTLDGVTVSRQLSVNGSGTFVAPSSLFLSNNATITVNTAADYAYTRMRADGTPTLLNGAGTLHLNSSISDSSTVVGTSSLIRNTSIAASGFTFASGITVDGFGIISDCPTTNNGHITANVPGRPLRIDGNTQQNNNRYGAINGASLVLASTTVNQSGAGVIDAGDASGVAVYNSTLNGGSLTAGGSGRFTVGQASTLNNLTNNAPVDLNGNQVLTIGASGIVNNGLITVNTNGDYAGTSLRPAAPGTLINGNGEVRMNKSVSDPSTTVGTSDIVAGVAGATLTFGTGQTLTGSGRIAAPVTMAGTISPGVGTNNINIVRNEGGNTVTFTANGRLKIEAASAASYDQLINAGTVDVHGTLLMSTAFNVPPGTIFDVVDGTGTVTGQFDQVISSGLSAPKRFGARYDVAHKVRVTVLCGAADIAGQGADGNGDGVLDNNDFIVFIDRFFNNDPRADYGTTGGIPGADGLFNNNDFVVFIDLFFAGCF